MKIMRKFIQYYKPYKTVFIFDMICAMIISLIDLAFPQILNYLNDTLYIADHQTIIQSLFWLAVFLLIMYAIRALCKYYVSAQGHIMGAQMERDMRKDLFDKFEQLSFSYYDRNNTGEMMSKLVSDLFDICEFAHHGPENVFISLLKIIGSFVLLMYIHVPLTILLIIVTLCMLLFSLKQNKAMQQTFMDNRRKIAGVNASLQDTLAGIRVVKSFANEDIERHKFARSNERFLQSKKNNYHCMGRFQGGNNFFQGLLYVTILVGGGFFIAQGSLEPIALATYALYINIFITPIEVLVEFTEMLQKGYSGFKRFNEVMETQVEIEDAPDSHDLVNVKGVIDYKDVSFGYDDEKVLDHLNIHIDSGKSIALVGPSGGGKTTMLNLIERFYDPQQVAIKINDNDKQNIYYLLRWIIQNYHSLWAKDNLSMINKRLRCNEYLGSYFTAEVSKRINRIVSLGDKATIRDYLNLFKFPEQHWGSSLNCGNILISQLNRSSIVIYYVAVLVTEYGW